MSQEYVPLGDLSVSRGGSVDPKKHLEEEFELYSIPAFDAGEPEYLSGSDIGSAKKKIEPGDVLLSRIVPHIRRAWVVGPKTDARQIGSGEWIIFRGKNVYPNYLRWVLVGDAFHSAFMRTVSGVGGSLLRARPSEVYKIKIPLPPLAEQKRMAGILDAADKLQAKRRESIAQLDTLLQSTFLDMFGDPVTNPMGWERVRFSDIGSFSSGSTPSKEKEKYWIGQTPWVSPKDMKVSRIDGAQDHVSDSAFEETNLKLVKPGHILIVVRGMILSHSLPIAVNIVPVAINQDMKAILPSSKFDFNYLLACILFLKRLILDKVSTAGHGTRRFDRHSMDEILVPVPPKRDQEKFAKVALQLQKIEERQISHQCELDTLFFSLQQRAFNGTL